MILKKPQQGQALKLKPNGGQVHKEKWREEREYKEADLAHLFLNPMF
jgi:hypothetical protein